MIVADSLLLVRQKKEELKNDLMKYDFSYLDYKLNEMLMLEWKIGLTKKTVSKNNLIKQLKFMHSQIPRYIINSNQRKIFEVVEEALNQILPAIIEASLEDFADVRSVGKNVHMWAGCMHIEKPPYDGRVDIEKYGSILGVY